MLPAGIGYIIQEYKHPPTDITYFSQILSLLQLIEVHSVHEQSQCLSYSIVCNLLHSISLFYRCVPELFHLYLMGENREFECLAVLCQQHWSEFCAKVPTVCVPVTESIKDILSIECQGYSVSRPNSKGNSSITTVTGCFL